MSGSPKIFEDEKLERLCYGLEPTVHLEGLNSGLEHVESTSRVGLNIDGAF